MSFDPAHDPTFPFLDFETDEASYLNTRLFWQAAFEEAVGGEASAWHPWMPDPFKDGHPIFSALDGRASRGVLLQQVRPSDDPIWFKCWLADAGKQGSDDRIPYLFMETDVSIEGRRIFRDLVHHWCARGASEASTRALIQRVTRTIAGSRYRTAADI